MNERGRSVRGLRVRKPAIRYFSDPDEEIIGVLMKQTQGANEEMGWKFRLLVGQAVDD